MRSAIVADEENVGEFTAIAADFSSVAHGPRGPSQFGRRAFDATIKTRPVVPLLWQHVDGEPIGTATLSVEPSVGLMLTGRIVLATARGAEAFALLRAGAVNACSVGFTPDPGSIEERMIDGVRVRVVGRCDVYEISLVTLPADDKARIRTVHSAAGYVANDRRLRAEMAWQAVEHLPANQRDYKFHRLMGEWERANNGVW